jgi:xanthine/CO dehydrogenase XdhC/CoxF family maturation factor
MESLDSNSDILTTARDWQDAGKGVAMCTVVNTWGSSPRPTGSQLLVDEEGQFIGSVSGGCIEGAVIREALQVIETGTPKKLQFGVSDQEAWDVGLACGGTVQVWVEKINS